MDVRQVHSVCSVYEAFGPVIFVAFSVFCSVYGALGLDRCGVYRVSSI